MPADIRPAAEEIKVIDHITIGVTDFARSTAFYNKALAPWV